TTSNYSGILIDIPIWPPFATLNSIGTANSPLLFCSLNRDQPRIPTEKAIRSLIILGKNSENSKKTQCALGFSGEADQLPSTQAHRLSVALSPSTTCRTGGRRSLYDHSRDSCRPA